jgi:hypothetical protein
MWCFLLHHLSDTHIPSPFWICISPAGLTDLLFWLTFNYLKTTFSNAMSCKRLAAPVNNCKRSLSQYCDEGCWFVQDGAACNTTHTAMGMVEQLFGPRIISKGLRLLRSSSLMPLGFSEGCQRFYAPKGCAEYDNFIQRCRDEAGCHFQHLLQTFFIL